ncbi:MAG: hypothetical protein HY261_05290, partial [Chloroflexi bacterium]|nr:hypothetical protein [Chloroflexota bacterium]
MKKLFAATLLGLLALWIAACGGGSIGSTSAPSAPPSKATPTGMPVGSTSVTPTIPPGSPPPSPLIAKPLEASTAVQTLSWQDKVTVIIPGGLLTSPQSLAIAPAQNLPAPPQKGVGEMAGYTVTLGNAQEFKKPLTIEMAYDPTKLPEDLSPQKALFASFWDTSQNLWVNSPITVDTQRNVATIKTNHLTTWKLYYILRGYGVKDSTHFLVVYDKQAPAIVGSAQVAANQFANQVSGYLEQAYTAYSDAKF